MGETREGRNTSLSESETTCEPKEVAREAHSPACTDEILRCDKSRTAAVAPLWRALAL
jgi:hypothetical protein